MIHLDTHVVLWLNRKDFFRFPATTMDLLEREDLVISPMVEFELGILHEIGRIVSPEEILGDLRRHVGLQIDAIDFAQVSAASLEPQFAFTRDPFDRLIASHASAAGVSLLTKDRRLRTHLDFAIWPS